MIFDKHHCRFSAISSDGFSRLGLSLESFLQVLV